MKYDKIRIDNYVEDTRLTQSPCNDCIHYGNGSYYGSKCSTCKNRNKLTI